MNERNFEIFQYLNDKVVEEQEQEEEGASFGHQIFRVEAGTLPQIYIAASRPPLVLTFRKLPGVFFNWICTYL